MNQSDISVSSDGDVFLEANPLLSEDAFQNKKSQKLFEAIDELRSCGANHEIDLPELVIVGDQSAGKSSLLQSLTDIPFPVADRLCTRFPTRIVSRRTPFEPESIKVSIEASSLNLFDSVSYEDRVKKYAGFGSTLRSFEAKDFIAILDQVVDLMGIPRSENAGSNSESNSFNQITKNFCCDILKVEIAGPNRSYFSILDLPGIFQSLTKDLTYAEKVGVRQLVTAHMKPKQSIIICVASGTNDLANQAVFDIASTEDPNGERTVGVITKCDITQHKNQLMDLARNSEKHLSHGWFVVRNRTPLEAQSSLEPLERQWIEESFFKDLPWNALPEHRRGAQALKKYLADLLCSRIKENFPLMLSTIRSRIKNTQSRLETLGSTRETTDQKRTYLTKLSQDFHLAASQALRGRYEPSTADSVKLRRLVREANDAFAKEMKEYGHTVPFLEIPNVQQGVKKSNQQVKNNIFMTSTPNDTNVGNGKEEFPRFVEFDQSGVRLYQDYYSAEEIRLNKYEKSSKSSDPSKEKFSSPWIFNKAPPLAPNPSGNQSTSPLGLFGQNLGGNQSTPSPLQTFGGIQSTPSTFTLLGQTPSGNHIQPSPLGVFGQTSNGHQTQPSGPSIFGKIPETNQTQPSGPSFFGKTPETNQTQPSGSSGVGSSVSIKAPENHQTKPSGPSGFGSIGPGSSVFAKAAENYLTQHSRPSVFGSIGLGSSSLGKAPENHQRQSAAAGEHANSRSPGNGESSSGNLFKTEPSKPFIGHQSNQPSDKFKSSQIYDWIKSEIKASRGTELQGIMNPDVLPVLFHKQIENWKTISEAHFLKVSKFSVDILISMLEDTCSEELIIDQLELVICKASEVAEKKGLSELKTRIKDLTSGHLQTNNPAFEDKVRKVRRLRFRGALERFRLSCIPAPVPKPAFNLVSAFTSDDEINAAETITINTRNSDLLFDELHISNAQNLEDEIHDILKAYYEIARDEFVEYVNKLIVEPYLNSPDGPVLLFSPIYVGGLSDDKIESLGAESFSLIRERADLEATLARLTAAEAIALKYS